MIELLVVMVIFMIIIIAASQALIPLLTQSKQQGKIAATNLEGMLGLEVLRRDIAHAGYGLYYSYDPKSSPSPSQTYAEVTAGADANGAALNDAPLGSPRPIVFGANRGLNGSDRIAIRSVNVVSNQLSEHWAYLYTYPTISVNTWSPATENIGALEYVVAVRPDQANRYLMFTTGATKVFSAQFQNVTTANGFAPDTTSIIFSLGTTSTPKMPFNRADYYIANANLPTRCAQGTGVLFKAVVDQTVGSTGYLAAIPLLDCVADMQVGYRYDANDDGYADTVADATADQPVDAVSARKIREVRVYILAQEGQKDRDFTYQAPISPSSIRVGEAGLYGRDFNLTAITNWQNYRWKLYTLIVETISLVDYTVIP